MTDIHITVPRCSFCGERNANSLRPFSPFTTDEVWHSCWRRSCLSESYKRQAAEDMGADSSEYRAYVEEMRKLALERTEWDKMDNSKPKGNGLAKPKNPFEARF